VIETTQTTTINSDCDGFELTTTQNYDITINSGVSLIDAAYVLEIGWPLNATVTNNGTITALVEKVIWVNNASISEIVNSGTIDIDQTQRLSANAFYQELPFASTKARTLYVNYMLAF
jgi:hypothetical protein